jgi:hypothetical protein
VATAGPAVAHLRLVVAAAVLEATGTHIFVGNVVYGIRSTISRGRMVLGSAAGAIAAFVAVWVIWSV